MCQNQLAGLLAAHKQSLVEASRNNLPTGQNSHLAVEPAAPVVLCAGKHADCSKSAAFPSGKIILFFHII